MQARSGEKKLFRVGLVNLGCAKNMVDAELMLGALRHAGYRIVGNVNQADVIVVNTCAFIQEAKEEAIAEVLQIVAWKKKRAARKIIVAGCLSARYGQELPPLLPEVDAFVGVAAADRIVAVVTELLSGPDSAPPALPGRHCQPSRLALTPAHYAYLKISEGCDNRCSYCVIPSIRGDYHSVPFSRLLRQARELCAGGVKELNIISQDTAGYGFDRYGRVRFAELLTELQRHAGKSWLRALYLHPRRITADVISCIQRLPNLCHYIDMPIQHSHTAILKYMGRGYTERQLRNLIARLRRQIPDVVLRTTLIVGFPRETERIFAHMAAFVREMRFERLGVFTYSAEEGTPAARLSGQIPEAVKKQRQEEIMRLQQGIAERHNQAAVGTVRRVLIDEWRPKEKLAVGRTQYDAPEVDPVVYVPGRRLSAGTFADVRITAVLGYDLQGEAL